MHCVRAAASRTFCTAGTSNAIRMAMMAMTTSNSINVKARRERMDVTSSKQVEAQRNMMTRNNRAGKRAPAAWLDRVASRRWIERFGRKDERELADDGQTVAVGPARLPGHWLAARQRGMSADPFGSAAAAALAGRHANDPAKLGIITFRRRLFRHHAATGLFGLFTVA